MCVKKFEMIFFGLTVNTDSHIICQDIYILIHNIEIFLISKEQYCNKLSINILNGNDVMENKEINCIPLHLSCE